MSHKKITQKVLIQFPADSRPSRSHITAAACCKVVAQYRGKIVLLLLQTPPEHIQLVLTSKDRVAIQQERLAGRKVRQ